MKKVFLVLSILFIFSACSEIEVKPDKIDPYAGDPAGIAAKKRGILIDTTK